jgi:hypothetical protein
MILPLDGWSCAIEENDNADSENDNTVKRNKRNAINATPFPYYCFIGFFTTLSA